jgi:hypothetical protein
VGATLLLSAPARAQRDTTNTNPADTGERAWLARHTPRGALWRAAALPGWGQVYNHQYLKLPFVYTALGGVTALALNQNQNYRLYDRAYLYRAWQDTVGEDGENPFAHFKGDYDALVSGFGFQISAGTLRQQRDKFRRNRDFSFIGIGLVYGLTILDAYISAHLLDFDVGEDLTAALRPHPAGLTIALRLDL